VDIAILHVTAIFAQVCRDTLRARQFANLRGGYGVGFGNAARLPHGSNVVDIYAEISHDEWRWSTDLGYLNPVFERENLRGTILQIKWLQIEASLGRLMKRPDSRRVAQNIGVACFL
jgi:hypothetical protein